MEKEKIIAECRKHWMAYLPSYLVIAIFSADLINGLIRGYYKFNGEFFKYLLFCLSMFSILLWYIAKSRKNEYLQLTETKVIGHTGVLRTKTLLTPLSKIQNVGYSSWILGKIFGYHTVIIDNAGTGKTEFIFRYATGAKEFVNAVQKRIS